jgi:hypothetical protein
MQYSENHQNIEFMVSQLERSIAAITNGGREYE